MHFIYFSVFLLLICKSFTTQAPRVHMIWFFFFLNLLGTIAFVFHNCKEQCKVFKRVFIFFFLPPITCFSRAIDLQATLLQVRVRLPWWRELGRRQKAGGHDVSPGGSVQPQAEYVGEGCSGRGFDRHPGHRRDHVRVLVHLQVPSGALLSQQRHLCPTRGWGGWRGCHLSGVLYSSRSCSGFR